MVQVKVLRDQSLSSITFSSSNRVKESMLANNDQDSIMYQVEYTMDKSSKDAWKRSQQKGSKGHVRIKGLLPTRLYLHGHVHRIPTSNGPSTLKFFFRNARLCEKEEVLVHGESVGERLRSFSKS